MPYRKTEFRAGHYYHLYNRGVNRQCIFFCDANWGYFVKRIRHYFRPNLVDIVAYCLMPTHYHLLVYLKTDDLSKQVMQPFSLSYTKAINRQQNRVGPLFQGPFRAKLVDRDAYLSHLTRYIHLNPVAAGLVESLAEWRYSSYLDYVGLRQGSLPRPDIVLSQFPSRAAYQRYVEGSDDSGLRLIEHLLMD